MDQKCIVVYIVFIIVNWVDRKLIQSKPHLAGSNIRLGFEKE